MPAPRLLVSVFVLAPALLGAQPTPPVILAPEADGSLQVAWPAEPGTRYVLEQAGTLGRWEPLPGYPATARGPAMAAGVDAGATERFWRVVQVDQQPPTITERYPEPDAWGIQPGAPLIVDLSDQTGIDPASIRVQLPGDRTFAPGDPALTITGNRLVLALGGTATLGAPGERVSASVTVADTLGHATTHAWTFDLAPEPEIAAGVFVFGSPAALASGQLAPASSLLPRPAKGSPASATSGTTWSLAEVLADRIVIAYTGGTAPTIGPGALLANAAPAGPTDIFYRRVVSVADDAAAGRLTLVTEEAPLGDFITEGAVAVGPGTLVLEVGEDGRFLPPTSAFIDLELDRQIDLDPVGFAFDGARALLRTNGYRWEHDGVRLEAGDGAHLLQADFHRLSAIYASNLRAGLEVRDGTVVRSELVYRGDLDVDFDVGLEVMTSGVESREKLVDASGPKRVLFFTVGGFPVLLLVESQFELTLIGRAQFNITYRQRLEIGASVALGYRYRADAPQPFTWVADGTFQPLGYGKPTQDYQGYFELKLEPKISLNALLYGTGGAKLSVVPSGAIVFQTRNEPEFHTEGKVVGEVRVVAEAAGIAFEALDPKPKLGRLLWTQERHLFPTIPQFAWVHVPASVSIQEGDTLQLEAAVNRDEGVTWQWIHNGVMLPGLNGPSLLIPRAKDSHSGVVVVRARHGDRQLTSPAAIVIVTPRRPSMVRFAFIPPGSFMMGSPDDELGRDAHESVWGGGQRPTTITRGFYMERTEVTWGEWERVWTAGTGGRAPSSKGPWPGDPSTPVFDVLWWEAVAFCNLRSQLDGLRPAYYRDAALTVPLTGPSPGSIHVDWNAPGYRLPTEAEWEYACRAGTSTATYNGPLPSLDVAPVHPNLDAIAWVFGNAYAPQPVGRKAPNAFGLHDMLGNVFERVWDYYGGYDPNDTVDPRGPATSHMTNRITRGGAYSQPPRISRSAWRSSDPEEYTNYQVGFRTVRGLGP